LYRAKQAISRPHANTIRSVRVIEKALVIQ
jgi:hypothetical protein